ncbi:hypothetical protein PILCRDRAFT_505217 [Piloderma croceum F 1598]|uniref:Uncharacterized protein n=1 Tax=Piloderma croceum (strain F 1598) TaxID=765440 RepID=A0A0C3F9B3_PILCF|nr:hypothetical protein PILCRDRAFT_505217 [Piloderma croceum F 1598]
MKGGARVFGPHSGCPSRWRRVPGAPCEEPMLSSLSAQIYAHQCASFKIVSKHRDGRYTCKSICHMDPFKYKLFLDH